MWCTHCQQDTPAERYASGLLACGRCQQALAGYRDSLPAAAEDPSLAGLWDRREESHTWEPPGGSPPGPPLRPEDWQGVNWVTSGFAEPRKVSGTRESQGDRPLEKDAITLPPWPTEFRTGTRRHRIDAASEPLVRRVEEPSRPVSSNLESRMTHGRRWDDAIGNMRYVDTAHVPTHPGRNAVPSNRSWWILVIGLNAMVCGAAMFAAGQGLSFTGNFVQDQSTFGFALYAVGQLVAMACLAGLVYQLHRCWAKTHGLVRSICQQWQNMLPNRSSLGLSEAVVPAAVTPPEPPPRAVRLDDAWLDA